MYDRVQSGSGSIITAQVFKQPLAVLLPGYLVKLLLRDGVVRCLICQLFKHLRRYLYVASGVA